MRLLCCFIFIFFAELAYTDSYDWAWLEENPVTSEKHTENLRIEIFDNLKLKGGSVVLNDIARCSSSSKFCEDMHAIHVIDQIEFGKTVDIHKTFLYRLLKEELPVSQIYIEGPEKIKAKSQGRYLDVQDFYKPLRAFLKKINSDLSSERFQLQDLLLLDKEKIPYHSQTIKFRDLESLFYEKSNYFRENSNNFIETRVSIAKIDSEIIQHLRIKIKIKHQIFMPFAKVAMKKEDKLHSHQVGYKWVDAKQNQVKRYVNDFGSFNDLVLKGRVNKGELFLRTRLGKQLLVKRGMSVNMLLKRKGIRLSTKVKALQSGSKGDVIKVLYIKTKKNILARVLNPSMVEFIN